MTNEPVAEHKHTMIVMPNQDGMKVVLDWNETKKEESLTRREAEGYLPSVIPDFEMRSDVIGRVFSHCLSGVFALTMGP